MTTLSPNPVSAAEDLKLNPGSLDPSALSMGTLMRELNLSRQPSWLLRKLMNALESQRIARKMGWSRAWNKQGLTIFRSLKGSRERHPEWIDMVRQIVEPLYDLVPAYESFVKELLDDPKLMVFFFFHNHEDQDHLFEGVTVSLGRKVPDDVSKRDRLDIVLEDKRDNLYVDGRLDRVRFYINPWYDHRFDRHFFHEIQGAELGKNQMLQQLYDKTCQSYLDGKDDASQQFEHWSIRYIDYFGARQWIPKGSRFL